MLILSRREGESLRIGHEVTVTVLGVRGNQVRIGIDAPKALTVHRKEVYERIQAGLPPPAPKANGIVDLKLVEGPP